MDLLFSLPLVAGWIGGLIINYLADVLPTTRRLSRPACVHCETKLTWQDYLAFRNCRACGKPRKLRTWIVQILAVASFLYFWVAPPTALGFSLGAILLIYFGVIAVIDLEQRLILHPTSAFGAVLGIGIGTYVQSQIHASVLVGLGYSLLGGAAGFAIMLGLYKLGELFARSRARRMKAAGQEPDGEEALGGGDVFLAGVLGLLLGWPFILNGLVIGILLAGVISLLVLLVSFARGRHATEALMQFIPYGPFFILGAFILLYL